MEKYVWLFPLIFIFHDMEEIIGFGIWFKRNEEMLAKKYPCFGDRCCFLEFEICTIVNGYVYQKNHFREYRTFMN